MHQPAETGTCPPSRASAERGPSFPAFHPALLLAVAIAAMAGTPFPASSAPQTEESPPARREGLPEPEKEAEPTKEAQAKTERVRPDPEETAPKRTAMPGQPQVPRIQNVKDGDRIIGKVAPKFEAPAGEDYAATIEKDAGKPAPFRSGTILYEGGDYILRVTATHRETKKQRRALIRFKVTPYQLAILDLKAKEGIPKVAADRIAELLRSRMLKTKLFSLISKGDIDTIMEQNASAVLAGTCSEATCAIQIGQQLAAHKILTGAIGRHDKKPGYVISIQVVDVEKGRIEFTDSIEFADIDRVDDPVLELTAQLSATMLGQSKSIFFKPPRTPYMWRSALFPGWGQWHEGDRGLGKAFFAAGGVLLVNYVVAYREYQAARSDYQDTQGIPAAVAGQNTLLLNYILLLDKKEAYAAATASATRGLYLLAGFWMFNLADSYFKLGFLRGAPQPDLKTAGTLRPWAMWVPERRGGHYAAGVSMQVDF